MDACFADWFGLDAVRGMGRVPSAVDVKRYVPLIGTEPELKSADSPWVIAYAGKLDLPRGLGWAVNPVCVYLNGEPIMYTPEEYGRGATVIDPPRPSVPPDLALPPLAP